MPARGSDVGYAEDVLVASTTQTASGQSAALPGYSGASTIRAHLNIAAVSGTNPLITVYLEDTLNGTDWAPLGVFGNGATGVAGVYSLDVTRPFADRLRVRWTITGTNPSFTFDVRAASQSSTS